MNGEDQLLGIVDNGQLHLLAPEDAAGATVRLTTLQMQTARSLESGELSLTAYEGTTLLVSGEHRDDWVYQAQVVERGGAIVTAIARKVFGYAPKPREAAARRRAEHAPGEREEAAESAEALLKRAREALRQESNQLQVVGRELNPEEKKRVSAIQRALRLIGDALKALGASDE